MQVRLPGRSVNEVRLAAGFHGCIVAGACLLATMSATGVADAATTIDVAPVWSGHPVDFALATVGDRQAVGYYDADRRLTVAVRSCGDSNWVIVPLPRTTGWDSHNFIAMAVDRDGFLHVAADMHASPLVYFRSRNPLDEPFHAGSFESIHRMTGDQEDRVTYPSFLRDANGELVFMCRVGSSGNGDHILNRYDTATRTWRRLVDGPILSGRSATQTMNAYPAGPVRGPDGWFHLAWVWRDTPDCETCHDVCYARSRDLVHWERSDGTPLALPISAAGCEVVDPVAAGGGLLNGLLAIGFDADGRVVLSYHAYDAAGRSQVYAARVEGGRWQIHRTTDWSKRLEFAGRGSIDLDAAVGPVTATPDHGLTQYLRTPAGSGTWRLDPKTLAATERTPLPRQPDEHDRVESPFPGMAVRWADDSAAGAEPGPQCRLRWETLGPTRDRSRPEPWPPPSMLRVIESAPEPSR